MKKEIIVIIVLLLPLTLYAQEVLDTAYCRIQYDMVYQLDTVSHSMERSDLIYLDIGQNYSKCYSYYTHESDSLMNSQDGKRVWRDRFMRALEDSKGDSFNSFPHKRNTFIIFKDFRSEAMIVQDGFSTYRYEYEDELHSMKWELLDNVSKEIAGYKVFQAKTKWRGRIWTVWFTPEVPLDNGPWKLGGLPGLIFEAYDEANHYHFTLIGINLMESYPIIKDKEYGVYGFRKEFEVIDRLTFLRKCHQFRTLPDAESQSLLGISDTGVQHNDFLEKDYR